MNTLKQARREGALARLESQLASGVKPGPNGPIALTDHDRARIQKECATLKQRI